MFWIGLSMILAGIVEFFVEYLRAAPRHFRMADLPMTEIRWASMAMIVAGLVTGACGLIPRNAPGPPRVARDALALGANPASLRRRMMTALSFALFVDQLKPATLAFIVPGMRAEYHLTTAQVAFLPMVALGGNVVGSLLWGHLADRIGRRAAVLLAAILFVATSINAAMPTFTDNLIVSAFMGVSAGGMLPTVYALTSEVVPRRGSGVLVLQAGLIAVAAYLCASGLAAVVVPFAGWRILWFVQLPFPLVLIAANRWIPESPAFLEAAGKVVEGRLLAHRLGVVVGERSVLERRQNASVLFRPGYLTQTLVISLYALAWGTVNWGFLTFLPAVLGQSALGMPVAQLLFVSSLLSIPGTALAAWLYSRWSSRRTMALYATLTAGALFALAVVPIDGNPLGVAVVLVALLTGSSAVVAVIGPYTAQIYPAACRGFGSGLAAGCGKSGGLFGPPIIASLLTVLSIGGVAAVVAVPLVVAAVAVAVWGREVTRTVHVVETQEAPERVAAGV